MPADDLNGMLPNKSANGSTSRCHAHTQAWRHRSVFDPHRRYNQALPVHRHHSLGRLRRPPFSDDATYREVLRHK
jgi:hypothetical protein